MEKDTEKDKMKIIDDTDESIKHIEKMLALKKAAMKNNTPKITPTRLVTLDQIMKWENKLKYHKVSNDTITEIITETERLQGVIKNYEMKLESIFEFLTKVK